MEETDKVTDLEFKWGKKRGVGGKKKEVRFYESFTYDGIEYTLYDCVYMHKEGEPEPYIGKLIKIWENADKTKKVKVQWFFHPLEILRWLGDEKPVENEIFLASGAGVGLANVNPLEAIGGKCNVVCISKDNRNRQPSEEELKMADYIFYRTFDVELCTILDKIDDKVGGTEIKFIFNRKESETVGGIPKFGSDKEENKNAIACNDKQQLSRQNSPGEFKTSKTYGDHSQSVVAKDVKDLLVKCESLPGVKPASGSGVNSNALGTTSVQRGSALDQKITRCKVDPDKDEDKSKWFRTLPWEERMRSAHEQGTLVLLQNLDPEYTSGDVEDIVWHAFKESCTAKMVQRTTINSPHSGQAFVIFKTREATERVIRKLREGCLMLPNGRPIVGSTGPPPNFPGKQSTYFGHLFIDKIKLQFQREMKDAVSTSHCSQPNTIEYDMAMEWCLLQSRSDSWWKSLYKLQELDLRNLKSNLKSK